MSCGFLHYKVWLYSDLLFHLKGHIRKGRTVSCPFRNCDKKFLVMPSFSSHLSRTHKQCTVRDMFRWTSREQENILDDADREEAQANIFPKCADESLFLNSLALFYLKLQAKQLLPSSVIHTIIKELQDVHDACQSHLFHKLKEKLVTLDISNGDINNIVDVLKSEDLCKLFSPGLTAVWLFQTSFRLWWCTSRSRWMPSSSKLM